MNGRGSGKRSHSAQFFAPDSKASAGFTNSLSDALASITEAIRTKALRSAAHAGAEVFYQEMRIRTAGIEGGPRPLTGRLQKSIYQWHDFKKSTPTRQVYAVGPNKKEAPHWFNVEYGHVRTNYVVEVDPGRDLSKYKRLIVGQDGRIYLPLKRRLTTPAHVPARPYARPTFDAKATEAVQAMKKRLAERINELKAGQE